ncbi:MAG TPA: hypothetical protein VFO83_12815, partial [Aggregicoccus sp.]|nr:hypothetical protein [Aggregicoccus sp.]
MSKQWVCAVAVLGLGLGGGCQEQQAPHFIGTVGANVRLHIEQAYLSPGSSTRVTAVAYDADGKRGAGTVRLEAPAGRFAGGAQVELALVDGSVTTTYNCDEAVDPRCTGIVSLLASWGEQRTLSAVNLSYQVLGGGGMAGGGGGGGSGSGGGALASNGTGDPFEVYLDEMGLSSLAATDKVVVRPDTAYGVGFYGEVIRPTDGKLVYISEQLRTVHVFVPDELVYSASTQEWQLPASAPSTDEPIA